MRPRCHGKCSANLGPFPRVQLPPVSVLGQRSLSTEKRRAAAAAQHWAVAAAKRRAAAAAQRWAVAVATHWAGLCASQVKVRASLRLAPNQTRGRNQCQNASRNAFIAQRHIATTSRSKLPRSDSVMLPAPQSPKPRPLCCVQSP